MQVMIEMNVQTNQLLEDDCLANNSWLINLERQLIQFDSNILYDFL